MLTGILSCGFLVAFKYNDSECSGFLLLCREMIINLSAKLSRVQNQSFHDKCLFLVWICSIWQPSWHPRQVHWLFAVAVESVCIAVSERRRMKHVNEKHKVVAFENFSRKSPELAVVWFALICHNWVFAILSRNMKLLRNWDTLSDFRNRTVVSLRNCSVFWCKQCLDLRRWAKRPVDFQCCSLMCSNWYASVYVFESQIKSFYHRQVHFKSLVVIL